MINDAHFSLDLAALSWTPAGPPDDPETHLMTLLFFGGCPMVLHAVQVDLHPPGYLYAKCDKLQRLVFGAEVVAGGPSTFRRVDFAGRSYLLVAIPTVETLKP